MLHSKIELTGSKAAGALFRGDTRRIEAIMDQTQEIARQEMKIALEEIGAITQANFEALSPIGPGNPGTLGRGKGTTPPRAAGTLAASWSHEVTPIAGDLYLVVGSDDPVSEYLDKGTGVHATGGSRGVIRAKGKKSLAVPAAHLLIGGSRGPKKTIKDVRFLKKQRGTRAIHLVERAQAQARPAVGPILRAAAKRAKRDIKAALSGK
jgi:hypothetical protein